VLNQNAFWNTFNGEMIRTRAQLQDPLAVNSGQPGFAESVANLLRAGFDSHAISVIAFG
jgi:hypothetical protein